MKRFLFSPYYVLNAVTLLAFYTKIYPAYRNTSPHSLHHKTGFTGNPFIHQEAELVFVLLFSFFSKYRRCATADEALQKLISHLKVLTLLLTYFTYPRLCYTVLGLFTAMYFVVKPERYQGPQNIVQLNGASFDRRVRNPAEESDRKMVWIVAFWADWCENCQFLDAMWGMLSCKFGDGKSRSFGKVDVVRFPELAEQFRIDTSGMSWQLPTIILFYKGKEIKRLPPFKSDGSVVKTTFEEKGVIKYFEMEGSARNCSFRKGKGRKKGGEGGEGGEEGKKGGEKEETKSLWKRLISSF